MAGILAALPSLAFSIPAHAKHGHDIQQEPASRSSASQSSAGFRRAPIPSSGRGAFARCPYAGPGVGHRDADCARLRTHQPVARRDHPNRKIPRRRVVLKAPAVSASGYPQLARRARPVGPSPAIRDIRALDATPPVVCATGRSRRSGRELGDLPRTADDLGLAGGAVRRSDSPGEALRPPQRHHHDEQAPCCRPRTTLMRPQADDLVLHRDVIGASPPRPMRLTRAGSGKPCRPGPRSARAGRRRENSGPAAPSRGT